MLRVRDDKGRLTRVVVPVLALENAQSALQAALEALDFFEIDKAVQRDCERNVDRIGTLMNRRPYKLIHRAPPGHAIVPKELLGRGVSAIDDGAGEFEDAERYCPLAEDKTSLSSKSAAMRAVASKLRRFCR